MPLVGVASLMDGMVLGKDVVDADRAVLIPAGSVLSRKHRAVLGSAGISSVEITEESAGLADLLLDSGLDARRPEKSDGAPLREEEGAGRPSGGAHPAKTASADAGLVQRRLEMLAHMFGEHKDDPIMRRLCRLAIKSVREGLIDA